MYFIITCDVLGYVPEGCYRTVTSKYQLWLHMISVAVNTWAASPQQRMVTYRAKVNLTFCTCCLYCLSSHFFCSNLLPVGNPPMPWRADVVAKYRGMLSPEMEIQWYYPQEIVCYAFCQLLLSATHGTHWCQLANQPSVPESSASRWGYPLRVRRLIRV